MKALLSLALVMSSLAFAADSTEVATEIQTGKLLCPGVYSPSECSFQDLSASGSNSCWARQALNELAADKGIEIDPSQVVCQSGL